MSGRRIAITVTILAALSLAWLAGDASLSARHGFTTRLYGQAGAHGPVLEQRVSDRVDPRVFDGARHVSASAGTVFWIAAWYVAEEGDCELLARGGEQTQLFVDDHRLINWERGGESGDRQVLRLRKGFHSLQISHTRGQEAAEPLAVSLTWRAGGDAAPVESLYPSPPSGIALRFERFFRTTGRLLGAIWIAAGLVGLVGLAGMARQRSWMRRATLPLALGRMRAFSQRRWVVGLVLALVVGYAALLRFEALFGRFGPVDHPRWAVWLQSGVQAVAPAVHPSAIEWAPSKWGGDPVAYLRHAREMRGFYRANMREPVFPALARGFLAVLDNQDIAVNFASTVSGIFLVLATWLLAREAFGRAAAFLAAALLAIEEVAVLWGTEGWRDETFSFFAAMTAWALVRLIRRPTLPRALSAGAFGGLAVLTRITSLMFLAPGIVAAAWLTAACPFRRRVALALAAGGMAAAIAAPYMINCARVYGDPLYAINFHTGFYRLRDQVANYQQPESAARYVADEAAAHPIRTADTAIYGLAAYPFVGTFGGWNHWSRFLRPAVFGLSAAGLFMFALSPNGRFLLLFLLLSLAPYALTWRIAGGGEWRFTMHAYPFYLAAAGLALREGSAWLPVIADRLRHRAGRAPASAVQPTRGALLLASAAAIALAVLLWVLPFWAIREANRPGATAVIHPDDPRDNVVLAWGGWGAVQNGCVQSAAPVSRVLLPFANRATARVQLHVVAPRTTVAGERVEVRVSGRTLAAAPMLADDRNQWIDVVIPADLARPVLTPLFLVHVPSGDRPPVATGSEPGYRLCSIALVR